jgi:hypothetical protein
MVQELKDFKRKRPSKQQLIRLMDDMDNYFVSGED